MSRVLLVLSLLVFPGCFFYHNQSFPPDRISRGAAGAPGHFVFDRGGIESDSVAVMKCFTPVWDLRDSTKLTLVRSANGRGDYEVQPPLRYGVRENELIRIHCGTGAVVGIVPR